MFKSVACPSLVRRKVCKDILTRIPRHTISNQCRIKRFFGSIRYMDRTNPNPSKSTKNILFRLMLTRTFWFWRVSWLGMRKTKVTNLCQYKMQTYYTKIVMYWYNIYRFCQPLVGIV